MIVDKTEFKGKPILVFKRTLDDKFPVRIGIRKAKIFVENINVLRDFVREQENPQAASQPEGNPQQ